jgi:xanthine dehydrogenase YagS FAD-binding subunit
MIKDVMPGFELFRPDSVDEALQLLRRYRTDAWVLGGGMDSLDWFKDRVKRPEAVVDISGIAELRGIRQTEDGLEIGALTTLTALTTDSTIRDRYGLLATAAGKVASPQIRNAATLGGNLAQDTRCWYYRDGLPCYRAGGNTCYADTPTAMNREHALFEANRCVAVTPSDVGVALVALEASMVIRNASGERVVSADDFFIGPAVDITRMTVLEAGDLLTSIRLPAQWAGARFHFEKVSDRETWDFALVSIASALRLEGSRVRAARVACGGVQCTPRRLRVVEDSIVGEELDEQLIEQVARAATRGARPLNFNHYKVPLMGNLVRRTLRGG